MIEEIRLQNFRSIHRTTLRLAPSGLTVVVGANGSGKSNVVRALDFIAALQKHGIGSAVAMQGGQRSLVPKSVRLQKMKGTEVRVSYSASFRRPDHYPAKADAPGGRHDIAFRVLERNAIRIDSEELVFTSPLSVAEALSASSRDDERPEKRWSRGRKSRISFVRDKKGDLSVSSTPKISDANVMGYVQWFGFGFIGEQLGKSFEDRGSLEGVVDLLRGGSPHIQKPSVDQAMLESRNPILSFAQQARVFRNSLANTKRFDLHAATLRAEQQPETGRVLSSTGSNLPGAVRWLKKSEDHAAAWSLILDTLSDIAPYAFDVRSNLLRSGREYVEFLETKSGRPVESWDASDGALRALAILVALETHNTGDTLVVEEPERGLHPWAIRFLVDHVRSAIERRGIQVVMTTHSPQVLEAVSPSEVVVATRTHANGTVLRSASELIDDDDVTAGELGRLWVKGLLGGYPRDVG